MIRKLRLRMTLLVISVLILVSVGIVLGIYAVNNRNIVTQAETALNLLAENGGTIPAGAGMPGERDAQTPPPRPEGTENGERADTGTQTPPPKPDETEKEGTADEVRRDAPPDGPGREPFSPGNGRNGPGAFRDRSMSLEEVASLSNSYTLTLDEEGQIMSWTSDRENLYDQETLQRFADQVLADGKSGGRQDTQFYRLLSGEDGRKLIVLDARLELQAGQRVLRATALVAGIACLLLSLGAWALIRRMVRPVEDAFVRQQQFVWDASHELKTPLAVISANADVLEGEIGENEYLKYIQSEVRRTDDLVRNLLILARLDRGTGSQEMRELDLSEALLGVLLPFESTVFEAGKTLETEIQENVRCTGNEAMLQQLAVILLSNALKYSNDGGAIRVRLSRKAHGCELRVENTGEGIAPKDLERIFDRFYRTDASRNSETGGEGLGLAIARSIVELHRGTIRAESEMDGWTRFIVELG